MTGLTAQEWTSSHWRPRRPLATDDLALGCWRQSREQALDRLYVEHSPKALLSMLVVDVDHPDTLMRAIGLPRAHPEPSWVAEGLSGRGHVGWVLSAPVCRTDAARPEPLEFAARVQEGLRRAVDGDPGYAGLLTKNPTHDGWYPTWGRAEAYELRDLARGLGDLFPRALPKRAAEQTGLGRNVHLFDALRLWAYRARYRYTDRQEWEQTVLAYALNINTEFLVPLGVPEVSDTARSVARWVWRKFSREGLVVIQTVRGRRRAAQPSAAEARAKGGIRGAATTNARNSLELQEGRRRGGLANTPAQQEARRANLAKAHSKRQALRAAIREGV
ncbi:replication initiation protein [Kineococcus endophyticus]|uniref:Replication initiation protein n=1 Tax=Kineococcus endophyticus TaxID=1181883 RepID=A0ABV3PDY0_9ACTN